MRTKIIPDTTEVQGTDDPQLFKNFRRGNFSYFVPLDDGDYMVVLGFLEPDRARKIGERVFDVVANGETKLENFDVLQASRGRYRTAVDKSFTTVVYISSSISFRGWARPLCRISGSGSGSGNRSNRTVKRAPV
ncbi:hypothetical protein EN809_016970 [Mesorhizobium sp. M2E.F.Ca.ET.166.01.1.1]|nr:hypothetical protein EN809_016970 [Mesorhizobium sp. M2E.F.Ca.ET.166.01.1.1]TGV99736.1 hypothetical protein EN797_024285 [Mesorhizobium sp. M2E.F.Ca.ET.154.01.1.1]